ncbi:MAG: hypothetical protein NZ570_05730 [Candidatus Caldarchaeum sp.]|nr:hypothetical protein [Candidatus Caldarchaeum sp.]MCS7137673.1 hypothetical protein [Candidatus Caldarchaeum sp.]MDW7978719.1 hypothetical protein [Candidatus Caldarchaeum sp.]MDW8358991.1 hypothetical protein [Candidatus Caldarchaeum sp.]
MVSLTRLRDEKHVYRDHDFVETVEGWFFGVVSDIHPLGRILAYLKYIPGEGIWSRGGATFKRVLTSYTSREVAKTLEMVRTQRPRYIFHDPATDEDFIYVPVEAVKKHYRCDEKLGEILRRPRNSVENICVKLVKRLSIESHVEPSFFGLSGSLLIGLHNPAADIDLVVYGGENFRKTTKASRETQTSVFRQETEKMLVRNFMHKYPLTESEAAALAGRCATKGLFEGVFYSLHGVKLVEEINVEYGQRTYRDMGVRKAKLRVLEDSEGVFTPALYLVEDLESGGKAVEALLCYDTTFAGLLEKGDVVEAVGKLERVEDFREGRTYYSLLVGSVKTAGVEYVKLLRTA